MIGSKSIGLDFQGLFGDSLKTRLTIYHEATHALLSQTSEFGIATEDVFRLIAGIKDISSEEKRRVLDLLYKSQLFTQEGTASLLEGLYLRRKYGKSQALIWMRSNLPDDYLDRFDKLSFVLDFSVRYGDYFTSRIPHVALQTDIRKKIVELDLLSHPSKLESYLHFSENNPDARYHTLIEKIRYNGAISKLSDQEICEAVGIEHFIPPSKGEVVTFLNYLIEKTGEKDFHFSLKDIPDPKDNAVLMSEIQDNTVIANMNLNLVDNGIVIWNIDDLLHYRNEIRAIIVSTAELDEENTGIIQHRLGTTYDATVLAFLVTGEKYMLPVDKTTLNRLVNDEFRDTTLIVKWGIYKPGSTSLTFLPDIRKPDVVIYNYVKNIDECFVNYFANNKSVQYIALQASEGHLFHTILLKDENGVLHMANVFQKYLKEFESNRNNHLIKATIEDLSDVTTHFNNILSVWMGLSWNIDWYKTILDKENLRFR